MQTELLYYHDAYLCSFEAKVIAHGAVDGRAAVALDRSAFYPEGGGQPADRGNLASVPVADVQSDATLVWHVLGQPEQLAELGIGAHVQGQIDWSRRRDHMQQHCGQHLLTAAFIAACGLPTVSFHLSDATVTIDLETVEPLTAAQVQAAEELANRVIWENRPITARIVAPEELAQLPLRKPPSVREHVRVVTIADFDYSACGGTHPAASGAVGQMKVLRWGTQRNKTRVEFVCGERVLGALRRYQSVAEGAAATLSVGVDDVAAAIERLQLGQRRLATELTHAHISLDALESERRYAAAEVSGAARVVLGELPGYPPERLRVVAQGIAKQAGGVALLGSLGAGKAHLAVACAPESGRDARALLQAGLTPLGGRGGGSAAFAQGGGPQSSALAEALAAMHRAAMLSDI